MKKIAVILSGCGFMDGSEIHEATACLLALNKMGFDVHCFAPSDNQSQVKNHLTKSPVEEKRNMLVEAARIARGQISDIKNANADDFDGAVYPGGFGAALNLCSFALHGADHEVRADVLQFANKMAEKRKPQAFVCIAPSLIAKIYGPGVKMTIGNDPSTIATMKAMGNIHIECQPTEYVFDDKFRVFSTPAYMNAKNISEVFTGIEKMIVKLKEIL